jgi:putative ABC transport system permease protein
MFNSYLRIAWRNVTRNSRFALINMLGLSIGMAVVILIGLWIRDEISFNRHFSHYDHIVQVKHHWSNKAFNKISTEGVMPIPAAVELRTKYSDYFKHVALTKTTAGNILSNGEKKVTRNGLFAEHEMTDILSLKMLNGKVWETNDPNTIIISAGTSRAIFGDMDPINKTLKIDNKNALRVVGIYEDFPRNTSFYGTEFIMPWSYLLADKEWVKRAYDQWNNNSFFLYAELSDKVAPAKVATAVKDILRGRPGRNDGAVVFMQPMSQWHLYNEFKNGVNTGGGIRYVWIFGTIGLFVLMLACINFMNLNTARAQKRAREVGIRKAIGLERKHLIFQFLGEAIMVAGLALLVAVVLAQLALPWFNNIADKGIHFPWVSVSFWGWIIFLVLFTGLLAGSYPAFYLSSFSTLKVLKGTFKVGPSAAVPRKILVVLQFTVSVALIIGTIIIAQQVQYVKNRPLGYDQHGLININMNTPDLYGKYDLLRSELINAGAALNMAESSNPATNIYAHLNGFEWTGKDPLINPTFGVSWISHDFGKTVGWEFLEGRDFSRNYATDSTGIILNQSAVEFMGLKNPIGETIKFDDKPYHLIGVIKNVVMESPFMQAAPTVFIMDYENVSNISVRLNPAMGNHAAIAKVEQIFKKYNAAAPFEFRFINEEYNNKFIAEERISKLTTFFALFAIFISCLGIFGLATFTAEQRTKEIGVRKVLGASVFNLWRHLSKEFLLLTMLSFVIAMPLAWSFMHTWLLEYEYRIEISAWSFVVTALLTLIITLGAVSYQTIKAALANPVNSLKME